MDGMNGTLRVSVVRDDRRRVLWVACPPGAVALVKAVTGAEWDHACQRWTVPTRHRDELAAALVGWPAGVSWAEDHRAPAVLCSVCGAPLAESLARLGDLTHIGCIAQMFHDHDDDLLAQILNEMNADEDARLAQILNDDDTDDLLAQILNDDEEGPLW